MLSIFGVPIVLYFDLFNLYQPMNKYIRPSLHGTRQICLRKNIRTDGICVLTAIPYPDKFLTTYPRKFLTTYLYPRKFLTTYPDKFLTTYPCKFLTCHESVLVPDKCLFRTLRTLIGRSIFAKRSTMLYTACRNVRPLC